MVPASQSTYDGSNATISASVCPWNLPKVTSSPRASSSVGGSTGTCPSRRPRSSGPDGWDARSSGIDRPERKGGWPTSGSRTPGGVVVWLRGRTVLLRSRRPVTGRVRGGGGGPPARLPRVPRPGSPAGPSPGAASLLRLACPRQRRVRRVDLRHPASRTLHGLGVIGRQVRVVTAGERAPGGLDRIRCGAGLDAEDGMGFLGGHGSSVARAAMAPANEAAEVRARPAGSGPGSPSEPPDGSPIVAQPWRTGPWASGSSSIEPPSSRAAR